MTVGDVACVAGRALDDQTAERLLGFEVEEGENAKTRQKEFLSRDRGETWLRVAFHSASLSAPLNVSEILYQLGWSVREESSNRRPGPAGLYHLDLVGGRPAGVDYCHIVGARPPQGSTQGGEMTSKALVGSLAWCGSTMLLS